MELNTDLTSLTSLPLDAGLFAPRRAAPPTEDDATSFRQHLDAQRGRDDKEPPAEPAPAPPDQVGRRDRPDRTTRPMAKRGDDGPAKPKDDAPALDHGSPLDDARPAPPKTQDAEPTDTAVAAPDEAGEPERDPADSETAEASAIVAEVAAIAAAPVVPIVEDTVSSQVGMAEPPAIEPVAETTPNLPKQETEASQSFATHLPDDAATVAADQTMKASASASPDAAAQAEPSKAELPTTAVNVEATSPSPDNESDTVPHTDEAKRTESTTTAKLPEQAAAESTATDPGSSDSPDEHQRKPAAKGPNPLSDPAATSVDPSSSEPAAPKIAANHPTPQVIAAPVAAVAAAVEKIASTASSSTAPRSGGAVEATAPQRLPQHLVGKPGEAAGGEPKLTEAEQVRLLQRVARAFQTAQQRDGEIRLRLSPPELGSLKLEIQVQNGVMRARVEAETQAAQSILLDNLPALRERLAEQNIRIDQFEVDLPGRQSQGQPESRDSQPGGNGPRGGIAGRDRDVAGPADGAQGIGRHHDGKLNVFI